MVTTKRKVWQYDFTAIINDIGLDEFVQFVGVENIIEAIGVEKIIETIGAETILETIGAEKIADWLVKHLPPKERKKLRKRLDQLDTSSGVRT